ncbi:MAG TPA: response regulator [Kofleriaceae bacterium]|nr:response regulator [Kofleriaceae bacterium]
MDGAINILLVDDEQRNLDALESILDEPGYRLLRAEDADRALRHLLENDVAAIVLDIKMPGVSGFELAQLIKGTKKFRQIPIVFLTAYLVDDQDILAGYGAGAVDYLTKPVNPKILRHKISVFADLFRKTRALAELNATLEQRVSERTAELERSEAALRAASQQKDSFLATLAHELRNPLAPLRTGLDLLLHTGAPSPAAGRAMAAMNRQLDHMVRLIDDLLDVSRISRGMLELKRTRTDLASVIEHALDTARPFFDQRKQTVTVELSGPVHAAIDATRVSQIVGNLLHNASKFTPPGGAIRVELVGEGGAALIRVIDKGEGIPVGQLDKVFDMFARIERAGRSVVGGGLGIGLALARQLAEMHGGSLAASSEGEGAGATFTLRLPTAAGDMAEPGGAPAAGGAQVARPATGLDIAVIEDNDDAADTLTLWLEEMGHRVRLARNGPDGLAMVREGRPDLVLCDVGLPGMDGVEVCRRIRALAGERPPVMVALTGWGMEEDRRRTREAGFEHHLVKPVGPDQLRAILKDVADAVRSRALSA